MMQSFNKDFDMKETAIINKMYYVKIAKYFLWIKQLRAKNRYVRKYSYQSKVIIKGRKKLIYDELSWIIDMYCKDEEEYKKFIELLDESILEYKEMIKGHVYSPHDQKVLEEEEVV